MLAIFLDIETSGLDPYRHHILEIAFKLVDVYSGIEKGEYHSVVKQPYRVWKARDEESVTVNGFTWDKIQEGKEIVQIKSEIIQLFEQHDVRRGRAVYICQNPSFDRVFFSQLIPVYYQEGLQWPYHWLDLASMHWALQIQHNRQLGLPFPQEIQLSKDAIANAYQLPPEPIPHSAQNGVNHLLLCYRTLVGFSL